MRYLYKAGIQSALKRGDEVEQFLRFTRIDGKRILSWLALKKRENGYVLLHHKQHDEGSHNHVNIYDFKYVYLPKDRNEPEHLVFPSLDEALNYASSNIGASHSKWVHHGMIQEEYRDFKLTENEI